MADSVHVEEELGKARLTRWAVTLTTIVVVVLFAISAATRWVEQREDCNEQRNARELANASQVALVEDFREALVTAGSDPNEIDPLAEDIKSRVERRQDQMPPPSACT